MNIVNISPDEQFRVIIHQAVRDLLKQGKRSVSEGGTCAYRNHEGLACVVGHTFSDEDYNPELDNLGPVTHVRVKRFLEKVYGFDLTKDMAQALYILQDAHDMNPDAMSCYLNFVRESLIATSGNHYILELLENFGQKENV